MVSKATTLVEIAQRAGVHVSTVSRALAADKPGVGSKTADRIRAIAADMGYQPHPAAAELRTGKSGLLGVLVPDLRDMVLSEIYAGVDAGAHETSFSTFVSNTQDDIELRRSKLDEFLTRRVEGIILGDVRLDGDELVETLRRRRLPYVLVNRRLRGHPSVTTDDILGGTLAAEHLLELGHEHVGIVAGPSFVSTCTERTHGFAQKYSERGKHIPDGAIVHSGADVTGGYEAATKILDSHPETTAIFAINDFAAIGVMGAIRDHGARPGEDIAVVGFNDVALGQYLPVPLTTVRSPMFEMGRLGARMLIDQIGGALVESVLLQPTLVARQSSTGASNRLGLGAGAA
jgi:LacI family transcriptional regulator